MIYRPGLYDFGVMRAATTQSLAPRRRFCLEQSEPNTEGAPWVRNVIVAEKTEVPAMRTFSYPKPLFHGLSEYLRRTKIGEADLSMVWTLLRLAGWLATIAFIAVLILQVISDVPLWRQAIAGLLLVAVGLLAGLRLGTHSASAYIKDVQRLNKVLANQNKDLEAANAILLREISAQSESASRSESA
jgi:hypothetical protein